MNNPTNPTNPDKPVQAANVPTSADQPRREIPREKIVKLAESIWHERNRPSGEDEKIWLEAESRLQGEAESQPISGTESRPYINEPAKPARTQTKSSDPSEAGAQTRSATEAKSKNSAGKLRNQ